LFGFGAEVLGVQIVHEVLILRVRTINALRVFDWAPVALGATADLPGILDEVVVIAAVDAVDLLEPVEVGQHLAIVDEILTRPDERDTINPKADLVIDLQTNMEKSHRYEHPVDERHTEEVSEIDRENGAEKPDSPAPQLFSVPSQFLPIVDRADHPADGRVESLLGLRAQLLQSHEADSFFAEGFLDLRQFLDEFFFHKISLHITYTLPL